MDKLIFLVKGSAPLPYRIEAFGAGSSFFMKCSCPSGRNTLKMCRHSAALLVGDVTNLVEGEDRLSDLTARAAQTQYVSAAMSHQPRIGTVELLGYASLADVLNRFDAKFRSAGLLPALKPCEFGETLELYDLTQAERGRRPVTASLTYLTTAFDVIEDENRTIHRFNFRDRTRPWTVKTPKSTSSYAVLSRALPRLLGDLEIEI